MTTEIETAPRSHSGQVTAPVLLRVLLNQHPDGKRHLQRCCAGWAFAYWDGNWNLRTCTLTPLYVRRQSLYMGGFTTKSLMPDWLNHHQMRRDTACRPCLLDRTDRLSAAPSVISDKLVWLSDAVMRADGARTKRKHDWTSKMCSPYRDQHRAPPGLITYLSPPPSGCGCSRPDTEIFMFHTRRWCPSTSPTPASSPRSARLSKDHACCFHTVERGGAHLPWRRRASGSWECHLFTVRANQLRLTSNRHSVTVWNWKTHQWLKCLALKSCEQTEIHFFNILMQFDCGSHLTYYWFLQINATRCDVSLFLVTLL